MSEDAKQTLPNLSLEQAEIMYENYVQHKGIEAVHSQSMYAYEMLHGSRENGNSWIVSRNYKKNAKTNIATRAKRAAGSRRRKWQEAPPQKYST